MNEIERLELAQGRAAIAAMDARREMFEAKSESPTLNRRFNAAVEKYERTRAAADAAKGKASS